MGLGSTRVITHSRKRENPHDFSFVVNHKNEIIVLLKGENIKNKVVIGGGFNKATKCYNLHQNKFVAYRSGDETRNSKAEIIKNNELKTSKDFFITSRKSYCNRDLSLIGESNAILSYRDKRARVFMCPCTGPAGRFRSSCFPRLRSPLRGGLSLGSPCDRPPVYDKNRLSHILG